MSDKETIKYLRDQVNDLEFRLTEARDLKDKAIDRSDRARRDLARREALTGPDYRHPMHCSDGRVWARPADDAREEAIRFFAAHALAGALGQYDQNGGDDLTVGWTAELGFRLWQELEARFADERAKRKAAEAEAPESEPEE